MPSQTPTLSDIQAALNCTKAACGGIAPKSPAHILVGSASRPKPSPSHCAHVCTVELPGSSFYLIAPKAFAACAPLAFIQEATRPSFIDLIVLGWELRGSYQKRRGELPSCYQLDPLTSKASISSYLRRSPSINGTAKARRAMRFIADKSASPRETQFGLTLGLPRSYGGYGTGIPKMNYWVQASAEARAMAGRSGFRCDLCWPEEKLCVEYQSRERHEGERSRIRDSRRTNALMSMGFTVILVTNDELDDLGSTDVIAKTVRQALGKRGRQAVPGYHARKLRLRRQLGLPLKLER